MGVLKTFILLALALFSINCSQLRRPNEGIATTQTVLGQPISLGKFLNTDGQLIDLDNLQYSSTVIVFASDTCSTCAEEARYWVNEFIQIQPTKILFVHYLLGGYVDDAKDWKQSFNVSWNVLYSENDDLYRKNCSAIITPCLLIKNNLTNSFTQTYNPLRKEDLERITGPWN